MFAGSTILITGVTGSVGRALLYRLLNPEFSNDPRFGTPERIIGFSRDETKQFELQSALDRRGFSGPTVELRIGDVRNRNTIAETLRDSDIVFHTAALKQVPTGEYFPAEAVRTNVDGAANIAGAILEHGLSTKTVIGISTDKACSPASVLGLTKALQERIFITANLRTPCTRFVNVRFGNLIASRGSVIPLFLDQISRGGPVTVTDPMMTRFLLTVDRAIDVVLECAISANPGEIYVPRIPSARTGELAEVLIGDQPIEVICTGARPGEKLHEALISAEEGARTIERGDDLVITPHLPELNSRPVTEVLGGSYESSESILSPEELRDLLGEFDGNTISN